MATSNVSFKRQAWTKCYARFGMFSAAAFNAAAAKGRPSHDELQVSIDISGRGQMRKPADLTYGVEERPPFSDAFVAALQHVLVIAVNLVYPLVLAREAGLSSEAQADMLRIGMVALAIGVLLQAIPRGP